MNISGEKLFRGLAALHNIPECENRSRTDVKGWLEFDKKYNIGIQVCTNEILQSVNNKTVDQEVDYYIIRIYLSPY